MSDAVPRRKPWAVGFLQASDGSSRPGRILPWLVGEAPLRDKRCLLVHMSVPTDGLTPDQANAALEDVWFAWVDWWQNRFPGAAG